MTARREPLVLIVSTGLDSSTSEVVKILGRRGVPCVRIDTEIYPYGRSIGFAISNAGTDLLIDGSPARPTSVWYRRLRTPTVPPSMLPGVHEFCVKESRPILIGLGQVTAPSVMSSPEAIWAAENKVHQLHVASSCGIPIPQTYVTNDPNVVLAAFQEFGGEMIAKPVRTGYVDLGGEQLSIYTSKVELCHLERVRDAANSPVIYQPLLPKLCDVRVTVVGKRIFVAEIDSQSDPAARVDWRATVNPDLPHRRGVLPKAVEMRVLDLVNRLGLSFAAIDLILSASGDYTFLEVNPNGQWQWLDDILGLGISEAVADWHMDAQ